MIRHTSVYKVSKGWQGSACNFDTLRFFFSVLQSCVRSVGWKTNRLDLARNEKVSHPGISMAGKNENNAFTGGNACERKRKSREPTAKGGVGNQAGHPRNSFLRTIFLFSVPLPNLNLSRTNYAIRRRDSKQPTASSRSFFPCSCVEGRRRSLADVRNNQTKW